MTKEIKQKEEEVLTEVTTEGNKEENKEITLSEVEVRAMKMGWKPKDEFDDDDEFVGADEFIKRKPLFDANSKLKAELKDVKKALRELANFQLKVREDERKSVLTELRNQKKQALEEGDANKLIEIDEQIADVRAEEIAQKNQPKVKQGIHPNFAAWVEKNSWYAQDAELRAEADFIGTSYASNNPDMDPEDVLKFVATRIKRMYPEKFQNQNRNRPSTVDGSSGVKSSVFKKEDDFQLSDEERKVMNTFVRSGAMTKEAYIAELKKIKGVA
jgi:hypothetical protein